MARAYKSLCYCTNLRRSAGILTDYYDAALRETGLTVPQYYLLINLSRLGSVNISRWAEQVGLDRSTMVRNLRPLLRGGLICEAEGHGKAFSLSPEGERVLGEAQVIWRRAQAGISAFLGEEDAAAILRIGEKLQGLSV